MEKHDPFRGEVPNRANQRPRNCPAISGNPVTEHRKHLFFSHLPGHLATCSTKKHGVARGRIVPTKELFCHSRGVRAVPHTVPEDHFMIRRSLLVAALVAVATPRWPLRKSGSGPPIVRRGTHRSGLRHLARWDRATSSSRIGFRT